MLWLGYWVTTRVLKHPAEKTLDIKRFLLGFIYITACIGLSNLMLVTILQQLSMSASKAEMIAASELYMNIDRAFFGVDPQLWIQQWSAYQPIDLLLIESYRLLPKCMALVLLGLILTKKESFRRLLVTIYLAPFIAAPLWYVLPAVTPNEMYRNNMFSVHEIKATQQQYQQAPMSIKLKDYLATLEESVENPKQEHPLVTTNPSMHVCWGVLLCYFAFILWRPLGFIFVPWLVLNILATLYTLQHYVIDLPFGILFAIITLILTNYLFKKEHAYYTGHYDALYFIDAVQRDIRQLLGWCFGWFRRSKKSSEQITERATP
jgi:membrane-associated phospholipid phosphatase